MALLPRVPVWVSPIGDPVQYLDRKTNEPFNLYYVTVIFSNDESAYIGKPSLDKITEVQGLLEERIDRDTFFDLDDTGKLNKKDCKRYKLVAFEGYDPRAKKSPDAVTDAARQKNAVITASGAGQADAGDPSSGAVETPPASQAAGPPSSVSPPDSSSEGQGDGEAPAPSGTKYADKPVPEDWGVE